MKSEKRNANTCRPREHVVALAKEYPRIWKNIDALRAAKIELGDWPEWCFLPLAGAAAIASKGVRGALQFEQAANIGRIGALAAWRVTQGIYRFDATVFEELTNTEIEGNLPCGVLEYRPEWCVYIETQGMQFSGGALYGFFAHLEFDAKTHCSELRLLLDGERGLATIPLNLGAWPLSEALYRMMRTTEANAIRLGFDSPELAAFFLGAHSIVESTLLRPTIEPLVSLLLYLCSQNAEIGDGTRRPTNPIPKKTKKDLRLFGADKPTTWSVGVRLGSALRSSAPSGDSAKDGTSTGPRPHIRRAHWHGFRSGPTKTGDGASIPVESRKFDLRWLPPITVNLENIDELPATIRPVRCIESSKAIS